MPGSRRQRPVEEVLAEVRELTGRTVEELKERKMGPGANPARRFAIWALNRSAAVSQHGIGKLLDVPYHQVTRLLGRIRKGGVVEPVAGWMKTWLRQERR